MAGPYTWETEQPVGAVDNITGGAAALRQVKQTLQDVATDWFHAFPGTAQCRPGWPRVWLVATRAELATRPLVAPYGRLAYAQDTNHLYRETVDGWVNAHPVIAEIPAATGLTGDGFLANPSLCGDQVLNYYGVSGGGRPVYKGLFVGRDFPCGANATYRTFVRFPLAGKPTAHIQSVRFAAFLMEKDSPQGSVELRRITDFETLTFADFNLATITNLGTFCTTSQAVGWVTRDVTEAYLAALGSGVLALQLRSLAEGTDPGGHSRFYGFVSADDDSNPSLTPRLLVGFAP